MPRPGGIDTYAPDAPQGVAIPGIPAGPSTVLSSGGPMTTNVKAHARKGRPVRQHVRAFHPIRKRKGGAVVIARSTGKPLSKHPLPVARAKAQLRAVEAHIHGHGH